jgi:hypothetical protein
MKARRIRPWLTWPVILLYLAALAGALALVWAADGRQWYLDGAGIDARLDMTFSEFGRWLATLVLGALALLGLAALILELASLRRLDRPASTDQTAVTYPAAGAVYRLDRGSAPYDGAMIGDHETQRMEGAPPVAPTERAPAPPLADDAAAVRASLEQMQRQLDALRSRVDHSEAPPREHVTAGR